MLQTLQPKFDRCQSFYNKAKYEVVDNQLTILYSYNTKVAQIFKNKVYIYNEYSKTTVRHIREFLSQFSPKTDQSLQNIRQIILETNN